MRILPHAPIVLPDSSVPDRPHHFTSTRRWDDARQPGTLVSTRQHAQGTEHCWNRPLDPAHHQAIQPPAGQVGEALHLERRVLVGKTAVSRTTIAVLAINHPDAVAVRQSLIEEGLFIPVR